jgi:AraC-like DNA-binding protein
MAMGAPQFKLYPPHPALSEIVSHIMILEADFSQKNHRIAPFPPTPQNSIHFYPRDACYAQPNANGKFEQSPASIIVGAQVGRVNLQMGDHHIIISVAFQPGGLYRLLGIPLTEIYDRSYDTTFLLGNSIKEVNERLKETSSHWEMKTIVENFLLKRAYKNAYHPFERTMQVLLQSNASLSMEKAASLSCLSLRQFERKSKQVLGYSPKMFARLVRFSKAYRLKENKPHISWAQLANTSGYFDQMHMIRDFKEFTGVSPNAILDEISRSPFPVQQSLNL